MNRSPKLRNAAGRLQSASVECRHYIPGEPAQLLLEFIGRQPLGPVDHEVLQPRVLRLDRPDPIDDLSWRSAEPSLLPHAVAQRWHPRRCSGSTPSPPLLVGIAHKAEWREPLVTLVVRGLYATD